MRSSSSSDYHSKQKSHSNVDVVDGFVENCKPSQVNPRDRKLSRSKFQEQMS